MSLSSQTYSNSGLEEGAGMWGWVGVKGAPADSLSRLGLIYLGPCLQAGSKSATVYGRLPPWEFPSCLPSLQLLPAEKPVPPTPRKSGLHPLHHLFSFSFSSLSHPGTEDYFPCILLLSNPGPGHTQGREERAGL